MVNFYNDESNLYKYTQNGFQIDELSKYKEKLNIYIKFYDIIEKIIVSFTNFSSSEISGEIIYKDFNGENKSGNCGDYYQLLRELLKYMQSSKLKNISKKFSNHNKQLSNENEKRQQNYRNKIALDYKERKEKNEKFKKIIKNIEESQKKFEYNLDELFFEFGSVNRGRHDEFKTPFNFIKGEYEKLKNQNPESNDIELINKIFNEQKEKIDKLIKEWRILKESEAPKERDIDADEWEATH